MRKSIPPSVSFADSSPEGGAKVGVSYEGGSIGSVKLRAVNKNKLTPRQRAQIALVDALGKKFGIKFVLFQSETGKNGRYKGFNGLYNEGVIYLDVNAGMYGRSMGQVAIVRTAAHELTHYMREFNEERYEELQEYLLDNLAEWKGKDLGQLVAQKMARDSTGKLTPEGALEEVVADGCEMMLSRTKVLQNMAEEKPGLFNAIKDWLQNYVETVKEAFQGVSAVHEEARAVESWEQEKLDKFVDLWYKGLTEAAERAAKSPAGKGGEAKYSFVGTRKDGIEVYETSKETKELSWKERKHQFMNLMETQFRGRTAKFVRNGHAFYATFAADDIRKNIYGDNRSDPEGRDAKINTGADGDIFDLVENAQYQNSEAERGKTTRAHRNVSRWDYFIKQVQIDGRVFDLLANVRRKLNGDYVYSLQLTLSEKEAALPQTRPNKGELTGAPTASDISILSSPENSNTKFQEREDLPDDRELLMATKAEGRNAESLTAYQKKVKALEALERKLRRQQDALESLREQIREIDRASGEEKGKAMAEARAAKVDKEAKAKRKLLSDAIPTAKKQIEKTEASIRRAEKALADMERKPELRQEMEKSLARWREQNPNDAAKAIREMQQERDELPDERALLMQARAEGRNAERLTVNQKKRPTLFSA